MRFPKPFVLSLLSAMAAASAACGPSTSEEDIDAQEDAVTSSCAIEACGLPRKLLAAKSFEGRPPARFRDDVQVDAPEGLDRTPRQARRATSRPFRWSGDKRVLLSANAAGDAPIVADDFLLVEVLDAATGELLAAATVGARHAVEVGGAPVAPAAAAGAQVDISPLLPRGRDFRLRLSGLDLGGRAEVSDVYVSLGEAPPRLADPYAPGWCSGAPLSREQALRWIAPGGTRAEVPVTRRGVSITTRNCSPAGCEPWTSSAQRNPALTGSLVYQIGGFGPTHERKVRFTKDDLLHALRPSVDLEEFLLFAKRSIGEPIHYTETGRYAYTAPVTLRATVDLGGGEPRFSIGEAGEVHGETTLDVTDHCYQLRNLRTEHFQQGVRTETLTVAYGELGR